MAEYLWLIWPISVGIGLIVVGGVIASTVRRIRRSALGTIVNAVSRELMRNGGSMDQVNLSPDASPRSLSGMNETYKPQIERDFPTLNINELMSMSECLLRSYFDDIDSDKSVSRSLHDVGLAYKFKEGRLIPLTSSLVKTISLDKANNESEQRKTYFSRVRIHRTVINQYSRRAATAVIVFQTALEYLHYVKENDIVSLGNPDRIQQVRYNVEWLYVIDESKLSSSETQALSLNCPSCAAPITSVSSRSCEYCGVSIEPIDIRLWRADKIYSI